MQEDTTFLLYSIVILALVGIGMVVYGIILIPIIPALVVKLGVACFVLLGVFCVIWAVIDYMNLRARSDGL
jgi:hypothetical protein